jgi:hypothetical protein
MVRMIGIRDFSPKSFVPPLIHYSPPFGAGRGLPDIIATDSSWQDPCLASGPEYGAGDLSMYGWKQ